MRIFMHFLDFDASEQTAGGKGAPRGAPATLDRFFFTPHQSSVDWGTAGGTRRVSAVSGVVAALAKPKTSA